MEGSAFHQTHCVQGSGLQILTVQGSGLVLLGILHVLGWGQSCMQGWGHYTHYLGLGLVYHLDLPSQDGRRGPGVLCHLVGCWDYFRKDFQGHEVHLVQVQT